MGVIPDIGNLRCESGVLCPQLIVLLVEFEVVLGVDRPILLYDIKHDYRDSFLEEHYHISRQGRAKQRHVHGNLK